MVTVCNLYDCTLSLKTRIGDFSGDSRIEQLVTKDIVPGLQMLTVHGRTAKQRYQRNADWDELRKLSLALKEKHPETCFIGNGDIFNLETF